MVIFNSYVKLPEGRWFSMIFHDFHQLWGPQCICSRLARAGGAFQAKGIWKWGDPGCSWRSDEKSTVLLKHLHSVFFSRKMFHFAFFGHSQRISSSRWFSSVFAANARLEKAPMKIAKIWTGGGVKGRLVRYEDEIEVYSNDILGYGAVSDPG